MKRLLLAIGLGLCLSSPLAAQDIRFGWGDHPSLRAGKWLRVDFRARVQQDVHSSEATANAEAEGALDAARKRIGIEGRLGRAVDYQAEYEIGAHQWRDLYLDYRQFKTLQVRAGKFKLPFGLDETTSVTNLDFIYRARISSRLAPGRDRGVTLHGRALHGIVAYEAGVFRNDGDNARPSKSARVFGGRTTAARLIVDPFRRSKSRLADFQAGVAISGTTVPTGFPAVRARTVMGTSFYDSNVWVKGRRQRTGLQARWRPGPFSLQAEFIRLTDQRRGQAVDDGDLSPLLAQGWYVSGTYAVTGERKTTGLDKPRHRFGAIEVAARMEKLSFGSAAASGDPSTSRRADRVLGNSDRALTGGINWSINRWVKVQGNLIREWIEIPSMGPLPNRSSFWSRALRFQFMV
jgi:phosphate-selective porin